MAQAESHALTLEQLDDHKQLQQIANMLTRVTSCNIDLRRCSAAHSARAELPAHLRGWPRGMQV